MNAPARIPRHKAPPKFDVDQLVDLLEGRALEVFQSPEGDAWFALDAGAGRQAYRLDRLAPIARHLVSATSHIGVTKQVLEDARSLLEGRAYQHSAKVWTRLASTPEGLFLDLNDGAGGAVEVTSRNWRIVQDVRVFFTRSKQLKQLPVPSRQPGGLEALRQLLHLDGDDWRTTVAFLLMALMPPELENGNPCPRGILLLTGEHQAGKTTRAEMIASVIDPRVSVSRALPRDPRDLAVASRNAWVLLFDNVSGSPPVELSDALCRLADGAGFSTRALYTNGDEAVFSGSRPVILTGIDSNPNRSDLASRCLHIELPPLPEGARSTPDELAAKFDALRPSTLGELLDLAAHALGQQSRSYRPASRLAAGEKWVAACEERLGWPAGETARLFTAHASKAVDMSTEADAVAQAVIELMERQDGLFHGNAKRLLELLEPQGRWPLGWPESPKALAARLKRAAPGLRHRGIIIGPPDTRRVFTIERRKEAAP